MKYRLAIRSGKKMFSVSKAWKRDVIFLGLVTLGIILLVSTYFGLEHQYSGYENHVKLTIVFYKFDDAGKSEIFDFLGSLKDRNISRTINFRSSKETKKDYLKNAGIKPDDFMLNEEFPATADVFIQKKYIQLSEISKLSKNIELKPFVDKVLFNKRFIESYRKFREFSERIFLISIAFVLLFSIVVLYSIFKGLYRLFKDDINLMLSLGAGKFQTSMSFNYYILFTSTAGIILGAGVLGLLYYFLMGQFNQLGLNPVNILIYSIPTVVVILFILTIILSFGNVRKTE